MADDLNTGNSFAPPDSAPPPTVPDGLNHPSFPALPDYKPYNIGDTLATRDKIMGDPSLRLSYHVETAKAKQSAQDLDVKRYTDSSVMPLILDDMTKGQAHMDSITQQIENWNQKLAAPHPIRNIAKLSIADSLGAGLVALAGGKIGDAIGAGQRNEQEIEDNRYGNEMNQYTADRGVAQNGLVTAQNELARAQGQQDHLTNAQIQEKGHMDDQRHADVEKAKDRWQRASNPGEVQQAADELKALGVPVSDETIAAAKTSAGAKERGMNFAEAAREYAAIVGQIDRYGGTDGNESQALDSMVQRINAQYGTSYPAVIGGDTWKKQNADQMLQYKKDTLEQHTKDVAAALKSKDADETSRVAHWKAEESYWRGKLATDRTNASANMLRASNTKGLDAANKHVAEVQAQLDSVNSDLAGIKADAKLTPMQKREAASKKYAIRDTLSAKLAAAKAGADFIKHQSSEDAKDVGDKPRGGASYSFSDIEGARSALREKYGEKIPQDVLDRFKQTTGEDY